MTKVALCFMTKDRAELSKRSIEPLLGCDADLWWMDGSNTLEGQALPDKYLGNGQSAKPRNMRWNVIGGPDAAVAYAVTECLKNESYTHIGIVENDVLLQEGWFEPTMALFDRARQDGLEAGAVSARCYEDRVLFQRDGYDVMHNLGFGLVIWTREAARLMLKYLRTSWTMENRRVFSRLGGFDIGRFWAFGLGEHWLCADWGVDRAIAGHGLASIALDPSPVEMIGQDPPLEKQGLTLATGRKLAREGDFQRFVETTRAIREGSLQLQQNSFVYQVGNGGWLAFVHQLASFPDYQISGGWRLKWHQGYGPFGFQIAEPGATLQLRVGGACAFMVSGGDKGAQIKVRDLYSGYECEPFLQGTTNGQTPLMTLIIPGVMGSRMVEVSGEPGAIVHGLTFEEPQLLNDTAFDHSRLPAP